MTDIQMSGETLTINNFPTWDLVVTGTIVPFLEDQNGDDQDAAIAAYIQTNTIPQLPGNGIPWLEFLLGQTNFGNVDGSIRNNLINAGLTTYQPRYDIINDNVKVTMERIT